MKKIIALLLALSLLLALTACGEKEPEAKPDEKPEASTQTPEKQEPEKTEPEKQETPAPEKEPEKEPEAPAGEPLELSLWSLYYDAEVWSYEEDDLYDYEDYSDLIMIIPDGEDSYVVNAEIKASSCDAESFRDYLKSYGFDAYEYAVNNAYDRYNIGGVECLKQEGTYWGEPCLRYFGRSEAAGVTVFIEIIGDYEDARVDELLSTLTFQAEDVGNVDFPWAWDGEPFSAEDASAMAGTVTVNSTWIPFAECIVTDETFNHAVAVSGDWAYILSEGALKQYAYDGASLVYEADIELDDEYTNIQSTNDGTIWISGFMAPLVALRDGAQVASYDGTDNVTMHPSGEWGLSWFSGPDCQKITLSGGAMSMADISFPEVSTISHVTVDEDYIYICGYAADDSGHKVYIYNPEGELQLTLTDADGEGLGSITFMVQTSNGFLGLDGNLREVSLWTADGQWIGTIEDSDLFGTSYPWFCGGTLLDDGSILMVMTEERADQSATELAAFHLSGF